MKKYKTTNTPLALFTEPAYASLSSDACILYGLFLDRENYSRKNGWLENERVFFIFTIDEIMAFFTCSRGKAVKLKQELEGLGLLEQVKGGFNKPTKLFLSPLETEQVYEDDSEMILKNEPYLNKPNNKKQDTIKDTYKPSLAQSNYTTVSYENEVATYDQRMEALDNEINTHASEILNNGVNDTFFEDKAITIMQFLTGSVAGVRELTSVILNAKKHVEKKLNKFLLLEEREESVTFTLRNIIEVYRNKGITNLKGFIYKSFYNLFEASLVKQSI